jgi:hypothetical protein
LTEGIGLGYVERISEEIHVENIFKKTPEGKIFLGKPRKRRLVEVERGLKKVVFRGWKKLKNS